MQGEFRYWVATSDGAIVIHMFGAIDTQSAAQIEKAIDAHPDPSQTTVVDLSGVTFIDSSGLAAPLRARRAVTDRDGSMIVRQPSAQVRWVLDVAGLNFWLADGDPESN